MPSVQTIGLYGRRKSQEEKDEEDKLVPPIYHCIFVPPSPDSQLAKELRRVIEEETRNIRWKVSRSEAGAPGAWTPGGQEVHQG